MVRYKKRGPSVCLWKLDNLLKVKMKKLEVMKMWFYRRMLRQNEDMRDEQILKKMGNLPSRFQTQNEIRPFKRITHNKWEAH